VSLFGRDPLTASYQTLALSPRFALGSLRALGALQAESYDDRRDMQPGKIEHEVRHGRARRSPPHPSARLTAPLTPNRESSEMLNGDSFWGDVDMEADAQT
jgi:glycogen debranching enzyme